jgi:gliding motility-associated-like protein
MLGLLFFFGYVENITYIMYMKLFNIFAFVLLTTIAYNQNCPALGPDQILPCGVTSTTLTADLSQCSPGTNPRQTTTYTVNNIPYVAQNNTGTLVTMTDDSQQGPFPIGFTFCFYGQTYNQFYIGSNGWISFSAAQPTTFTSQTIPTAAANVPKNCIMGPWQDWHPGIGGQIRYQTQGVAPCRKLIVSWINIPMFSCTGNLGTFHIVIHESTNVIENFIQSKPACLQWSGGTAVQGIHDATGATAVVVPGRNSTAWTANNDAWQWTPNGPAVTPTLTWYQVGVAAPIGTGPTLNVTPPAAGAQYTCRFVYPTCNAGWATCNTTAGPGPDTVFILPGTAIPTASPIFSLDTICWQSNNASYLTTSQPGVTLNWNSIAPITFGQGSDSITVDWSSTPPGLVVNAVQVTPELNGCVGTTQTFDVYILNIDPVIQSQQDLCEYDDTITLNAIPTGGQFSGVGIVGNQFIPNVAIGTNDITYTYQLSGCIFDTTTQITVYPTPILDSITPFNPFYELCETDTINIVWSAQGFPLGGYFEWTWQNQTTQQSTLTTTLTWYQEGTNEATVIYYVNGCISNPQTSTVTISHCPETLIFIPNSFTPDGDEYNNTFQPIFTSGFDPYDFNMVIFNRWGEIIFETNDAKVGWDGTYQGKVVKEGTYIWEIVFGDEIDDSRYVKHGNVTLFK